MPAMSKFNCYVADRGNGKHNHSSDTQKILLTNIAPNAGDTVVDTTTTPCTVKAVSNGTEVAAGNGYTKGGAAVGSPSYTQTGGVAKMTGNAVSFAASGGSIGPFRYAVLYNDTTGTTATRPVIGSWDYGTSITLNDGESIKLGKDVGGNAWDSTTPMFSDT